MHLNLIVDLSLSQPQADRLCLKINKMKQMKQPQEKVDKFIRRELDNLNGGISGIKSNDKAKGFVERI